MASINNKKLIDNNGNYDIIFYTPKDIQQIFRCGKNQAYQLIHSSGFPKIQVNNRILIPKGKLEKWVNGNVGKKVTY